MRNKLHISLTVKDLHLERAVPDPDFKLEVNCDSNMAEEAIAKARAIAARLAGL